MQNKTLKLNVLHNRCDCMNRVHGFANEVVPELLEELVKGFKLTFSYNLYGKDKDRLQTIIDAHKTSLGPNNTGAYLSADQYNITLGLSDKYPVWFRSYGSGGVFTYKYYKHTVFLWKVNTRSVDFQPLPLYTHRQMDDIAIRIKQIENDISECQNELSPLKRLLGILIV